MDSNVKNVVSSLMKGGIGDVIGGEDIVLEVMREIIKDEIKNSVHDALDKEPELKEELRDAIKIYFEARIKEMYASLKLAKAAGKLGLHILPDDMKEELSKEVVDLLEKEIGSIIEKGLD